jgi:hypothetical protein
VAKAKAPRWWVVPSSKLRTLSELGLERASAL